MNSQPSLFERLNAPFPYDEYKYDAFGDNCFVSGQSVTQRLNEVLGVGFWKYRGLYDTEKIVTDLNGKNPRVKIFVEFTFYNAELKEWIPFVDVGSEQIKPGMHEGDATKAAITDAFKKAASRIGVASDLYKGLITWDKQQQKIILPPSYYVYYEQMGWQQKQIEQPSRSQSRRPYKKNELTQKLKERATPIQASIKSLWKELAGCLDGLEEWYTKKQEEQVTDQQIISLLRKKLAEKKGPASA